MVQGLGLAGTKNGVLLRMTREAGFQILVTVDRCIEYQQNIPKSGLALGVLQARSTRLLSQDGRISFHQYSPDVGIPEWLTACLL